MPALSETVVGATLMSGDKVSVTQSKDAIELLIPESKKDPIDTIIVLELDRPHGSQNTSMPNTADAGEGK